MKPFRKPSPILPCVLLAALIVVPPLAAFSLYVEGELAPLAGYVAYAKAWDGVLGSPAMPSAVVMARSSTH